MSAVSIGLIQQALHAGLRAAYVVCDRWFTTPTLVSGIVRETGCDVIGMLKNGSLRYEWKGQRRTLAQICRALRCTWTRHTVQGSIVVYLPTPAGPLAVKLVCIRDRRGHSRKWLALLCTDLSVADDEVVRLYGKRWEIETFFKVNKSFLGLAKLPLHTKTVSAAGIEPGVNRSRWCRLEKGSFSQRCPWINALAVDCMVMFRCRNMTRV